MKPLVFAIPNKGVKSKKSFFNFLNNVCRPGKASPSRPESPKPPFDM